MRLFRYLTRHAGRRAAADAGKRPELAQKLGGVVYLVASVGRDFQVFALAAAGPPRSTTGEKVVEIITFLALCGVQEIRVQRLHHAKKALFR